MTWLYRPDIMNSTDVRELDKSKVFDTDVTINSYEIINPIANATVSTLRPITIDVR